MRCCLGAGPSHSGESIFIRVGGLLAQCGADPLSTHGVLDGLVLTEEVESEFAKQRQVLRGVAFAGAAAVLVEGHVQHPVAAGLDAPVPADEVSQLLRVRRVAAQILALLGACLPFETAAAGDLNKAA